MRYLYETTVSWSSPDKTGLEKSIDELLQTEAELRDWADYVWSVARMDYDHITGISYYRIEVLGYYCSDRVYGGF